ncbi:hypothetical protein RvY_12220 [Ramazzottius varieornatus]|uniref:Uncharacterized protein n=1 Tax=Ramazzottius varieornatus TaxID=947166 RepID=A0A1D1VKR8_RAMVA|nr:hypothetical protein RvY_12220 [Ramazzottius varieornatus]
MLKLRGEHLRQLSVIAAPTCHVLSSVSGLVSLAERLLSIFGNASESMGMHQNSYSMTGKRRVANNYHEKNGKRKTSITEFARRGQIPTTTLKNWLNM